jgi:hypothetical protein
VTVICEHCGLKYEDELQSTACPHRSFEAENMTQQSFTNQKDLEACAGFDLTDAQRLELSNDLTHFWQSYQCRPDVMWLRVSFGLVRFSKAGVFMEIGEALGHQVRPITDKEYSLLIQEYPDLERVLLG